MYRIIDGRSSGKTMRLMCLAKENNAIIACSNPNAMRDKAYCYGITGLDFISYEDLFSNKDFGNRNIMIDELGMCLSSHITNDIKIIGYTLSNED